MTGLDRVCGKTQRKPRNPRSSLGLFLVALSFFICAQPAFAAGLGLLTDNVSKELRLFNAESGGIVTSLPGSSGVIGGDCALSKDESTGFSSNAGRNISVFDFPGSVPGKAIEVTSVEISNAGVDMSLSPDGSLLVSTGAGHVYEPLSIIDTARKIEVAASELFLDHTSAEFCDDGTLLVTTNYGNSFARPFDNAMYDARVGPAGDLQLGGNRLSSGAQPNNGSCAPGSRAGVLLDREAGLTSFTLPGLKKADFAALQGGSAVSAVFSRSGDRLYVRTTNTIEAFTFNPINGEMKADWVRQVPFSAEYFGIDQIAVEPDSGKLFVDGGRELLIIDPETGEQTGSVHAGDATGVCFAQRKPITPSRALVSIAP